MSTDPVVIAGYARTPELVLRISLGATAADIRMLILTRAARITFLGLILGSGAAVVVTSAIVRLVFGAAAPALPMVAGSALALGCVALVTSLAPAMRASRIDPVRGLRSD